MSAPDEALPAFEELLDTAANLAQTGSRAPNTLKNANGAQSRFARWSAEQTPPVEALPADPVDVLRYITARVSGTWIPERGRRLIGRSAAQELQGICLAHRRADHSEPTSEAVKAVIAGASRQDPPLRQQPPLGRREVLRWCLTPPQPTAVGFAVRLLLARLAIGDTTSVRAVARDVADGVDFHAGESAGEIEVAAAQLSLRLRSMVSTPGEWAAPSGQPAWRPGTRGSNRTAGNVARRLEQRARTALTASGSGADLDEIHQLPPDALSRALMFTDPDLPRYVRDRAAVLLGIGAGLRGGELGQLTWEHLDSADADLLVGTVRRTKTGPSQPWSTRTTSNPALCPAAALAEWRMLIEPVSPNVFPGVGAKGDIRPSGILCRSVSKILARYDELGVEQRASHALRRTTSTRYANAGISEIRIGKKLRHRDMRTTALYLPTTPQGNAPAAVDL